MYLIYYEYSGEVIGTFSDFGEYFGGGCGVFSCEDNRDT